MPLVQLLVGVPLWRSVQECSPLCRMRQGAPFEVAAHRERGKPLRPLCLQLMRSLEARVKRPLGLKEPPPVWHPWAEVPRDVAVVAAAGPWFLEIFSGTAMLTKAARAVPPTDRHYNPCDMVPQPFDVVDADNWDFIMALVHAGAVRFLHCGTPCNTFSAARKLDGGPPPLRSQEQPPPGFGERCYGFLGEFVPPTLSICMVEISRSRTLSSVLRGSRLTSSI